MNNDYEKQITKQYKTKDAFKSAKIINELTLSHLKQNKGRTVITLIGIIISVALITAVIIGGASYLKFYERAVIASGGNWHMDITGYSDDELNSLKSDKRVEKVGVYEEDNKGADGVKLKGAKSERLGTGFIYRGDEVWLEQQAFESISGAYPKTPHELMIHQQYIEKNALDWKVGDNVILTTGCRMLGGDMLHFPISGEFSYAETFEEDGEQSFKLVGIINDDCSDEEMGEMFSGMVDKGDRAWITLKNVTPFSMLTIGDIARIYGYKLHEQDLKKAKQIWLNDDLLGAHLCGQYDSELIRFVLPMLLVVLLLIIIASVVLIYNAFGMSLGERVRYLGMLASVGATAKQKKQSVYFEGLFFGFVGIPCGLLLGLSAASVLASVAGNLNQFMQGTAFENGKINLTVPLWSIIAIIAISTAVILLSIRKPAKRASEITAIDAIRTGGDLKLKAKKLKSSKLIRKIFGFEGELANKNLKRNGRRGRLIIASIAISIVLFISVNYFCYIFGETKAYNEEMPYQIEVCFGDSRQYDEFCTQLLSIKDVKRVYSAEDWSFGYDSRFPIKDTYTEDELYHQYNIIAMTGIGDQTIAYHGNTTPKYSHLWEGVQLCVHFVEDEDFNKLCEDNGLNPQDYYEKVNHINQTKKAVILNNVQLEEGEDDVFTDGIIGEYVRTAWEEPVEESYNENTKEYEEYRILTKDELKEKYGEDISGDNAFQITGMVKYDKDNYLFKLCRKREISCFVPLSMSQPFCTEALDGDEGPLGVYVGVECNNHREVAEQIGKMLDNGQWNNTEGASIRDIEYYAEQSRQIIITMKVFLYAFLTLITLITLANIINSISTSLMLRKKEFAMLQSVGVTPKGFSKMISYECLLYGVKALAFGIPISVCISIIINRIVGDGALPYSPNILLYIIVILSVFALVGLTMLYGVRKAKNSSIVDTLKEDMV